jgi:histidinol-phosphate aminotransferase
VVLASPNNPTGDAAPPAAVARLLARLDAPLLLDNAYAEFCRHDYRPLLDRHPNLVLFGTFSKAFSLAGLRLGYLLARPELAAELIKVKPPYNLGWAGIEAGCAVLELPRPLARRVRLLRLRRERWIPMLAGFGLEVFPSEANFLLVRCRGGAEEARRVRSGLAERGILVRDVGSYPGLAGCLRIAVGSGAAGRALAAALAELLGAPAGEAARPSAATERQSPGSAADGAAGEGRR